MKISMKIDITTGDEITPKEVQFSYPFLFDDRQVLVKAYTQETILAENTKRLSEEISEIRVQEIFMIYTFCIDYIRKMQTGTF